MSGRPEVLFPLFAPLETLSGIGAKTTKHLASIGIEAPADVIFSLPVSGINRRMLPTLLGVIAPTVATVEVSIERHHPARAKGRPYRIDVADAETSFQLVYFHAREDWLRKQLPVGDRRVVSGKVELFDGVLQMVHPDHVLRLEEKNALPKYEPVYPLTQGVTLKTFAKATASALGRAPVLDEWIDPALLKANTWPSWNDALVAAHIPSTDADLLPTTPSRERLAYDELFAHQLTLALARQKLRRKKGVATKSGGHLCETVLNALPYKPTSAQLRAFDDIKSDLASELRMNRLLQGDVGSGKTLVALLALLSVVEARGQGVLMAPTEVLARQHFEGLRPLFEEARVISEILTGRDSVSERKKKLEALEKGQIQVLIGTHAVFQDEVRFKDLRLAIIDEQHRFGVAQRMALGAKGARADTLVMTATPIPRSLSLAQYGDMDVSILDEKPPGRTPVTTSLVSLERLDEVVSHLKDAINDGRQAYWVCPLVDESEVSDLAAAEQRFERLRANLEEGAVGLVHGQMPWAEKDTAMNAFVSGQTKVLVATTVIEVGVDVPNASIMVIERAEHFGLAQLHQLRGRVGRGAERSSCLLMFRSPLTDSARRRLEIMRETNDGFRIAEEDLAMRGAGDVLGTAQSGLPRFRIADLETQAGLAETAQKDARNLLSLDPALESERGKAARVLLWLMRQDQAIEMISVG